ncbi:MAG: ABC transporter permease [Geobacteraceae bacterium GWC2_58_44]|nr:MAG: ABC transporter permease [Geobacteraceae bacterium GWC2_58_44]HBG07142.1 ABC transporter permease [Geobacter sp.]
MYRSVTLEPIRLIAAFAVAGALAGCAVGPEFRRPEPPASSSNLSETQPLQSVASQGPGGNPQRLDAEMAIPAQWWSLFRSPVLDRLVRSALEQSPTLAQARARLARAREAVNAETGATRYPAVDANLSAKRQKVDPAAFGVNVPVKPAPFTLYNASVSVSYALDLFGGNRRALEGLAAKVDYQRFELEAARQTLAANVVGAAIREAALQAQIATLQELLAAQSRQLDIMGERFRLGAIAAVDLRNQSLLLEQTRASLPPLEKQLVQVSNQLAVYLGREPAQGKVDSLELSTLHLPEELPLSLPSALARQRPDIRAAEALWHAASAEVGVATANMYPQIILSGSVGSQRTSLGDLWSGVNVWNIGGNLMQPVFRGGELQARKRAALAAYDEAGAAYRQTVLQGLQQVADTLYALDADARALKARADAAHHARLVYETVQQQYQLGGVSHLVLLDAQRQQLQAEFQRIQSQADRYADTAALLHALGGGWWNGASEGGI